MFVDHRNKIICLWSHSVTSSWLRQLVADGYNVVVPSNGFGSISEALDKIISNHSG